MAEAPNVVMNEEAQRFEIALDGQTAFAEYSLHPGTITLPHTVVPEVCLSAPRHPLMLAPPTRGRKETGRPLGSPPWKRGRSGAAGCASRGSGLAL